MVTKEQAVGGVYMEENEERESIEVGIAYNWNSLWVGVDWNTEDKEIVIQVIPFIALVILY